MFRSIAEQGTFSLKFKRYGTSVLGAPLYYLPSVLKTELLVIAGIHGEEAEGVFLLSRIIRSLNQPLEKTAFVLAANPDGLFLGTRANANGVDLNRNWPTKNWKKDKCFSRPYLESKPEIELSAGIYRASEPETKALLDLIQKLSPEQILAIHSPLACIDSLKRTPVVLALEKVFSLPWVEDIGYPTPGSLGSWCKENKVECITLELPRQSGEEIVRDYQKGFTEILMNDI